MSLLLLFLSSVGTTFCFDVTPTPAPTITPYFQDVSEETGLSEVMAFRIGIADVNNDMYPDLLIHTAGDESSGDVLDKQFLYLNQPGDDPDDPHDRRFVDFTEESGIRANRQGTEDGRHSSSAIFGDVDNDGDMDIFSIVYLHRNYDLSEGTNELMLNDGEGHFVLAPNSPFHNEPIYNTATAVFLDYDNDSSLDLFIGNWYYAEWVSQDHLYHGHGDGSFTNVTEACGILDYFTSVYACAAFDWNDDGFMDIFVPSYSHTVPRAQYYHWQNNGDGTFTDVKEESLYGEYGGSGSGRASFGTMPCDYDNDGDIDFLEVWVHGSGDGEDGIHTTTATNEAYVCSWDFFRVDGRSEVDPRPLHHGDHYAHWFDIENDGLRDFTLTESGYNNNRIYIFKQYPDHTFLPVTAETGLDVINEADLPPGNASPLDYDLDGDEDIIVGFGDSHGVMLWRNDKGNQNNWIRIVLKGAGKPGFSNRCAVGARVKVTAGNDTYTREVHAGHGHQSPQIPLAMLFGLGDAETVDQITVRWPNQDLSELIMQDVPVNRTVVIQEYPGEDKPEKGMRFNMPNNFFTPGDKCRLDAYFYNDGPDTLENAVMIVMLDIYGYYYYYDDWTMDIDAAFLDVPVGTTLYTVIPEFVWPETGEDEITGLMFYGAFLNENLNDILGGIDGLAQWSFGYGPS